MNGINLQKWYGTLFLLRFSLLISMLLAPLPALAEPPKATGGPDLTKHPLYSTYQFNKDGKHVYFSSIPQAVEGISGEVMKHDAILRKKLKAMGLEVVFYSYHKGADAMPFVRQGDIDMGTAGAPQVLNVAATAHVQITGMTKVSSASLIVRKGVVDISGLKGKRIGYPDGSTAHLGVLTALLMAGMKDSDVQMMPIEVGDLSTAMAENRIDAFSAFEPIPTAALAQHKDFTTIHRFSIAAPLYQSRQFAEKYPAASREMHASYARSLRWMKKSDKNLATAVQWTLQAIEGLTGKKPETTVDQLMAVAKTDILRFPGLPAISADDFKRDGLLHKSFSLLKEQGKMPADASWENVEKVVNVKIMNDILANPKKYQLDSYKPE